MLDLKTFSFQVENNSMLYQDYVSKLLDYRKILFYLLEDLMNPQNFSPKAMELKNALDKIQIENTNISIAEFFEGKFLKAKILENFVDQIFLQPALFEINFDSPPSSAQKLWLKTLLVHDFFYYGPITFLLLSSVIEKFESLKTNPLWLFLLEMVDPSQILEVRVNNASTIFFETKNKHCFWPISFVSNDQVQTIIERIIIETNSMNKSTIKLNASSPIADFEHVVGFIRCSALIPPAAQDPFLTLRVHPEDPYSLDDLQNFGMLDSKIKYFLTALQKSGATVAIAGTMGSGKTTLLSALAELWPENNGRKATIEDTPELRPKIRDLIKMRTLEYGHKDPNNISVAKLGKACKRHSVRYVVLSEARDSSAWDILQLSQSILGSLMTFHYTLRSDRFLVDQALNTLTALCRQHPLAPPGDEIKHLISSMIQILILVEQNPIDKHRRITNIFQIIGFDEMNGGHFKYVELFNYSPDKGFTLINMPKDILDYFKNKGVNYQASC